MVFGEASWSLVHRESTPDGELLPVAHAVELIPDEGQLNYSLDIPQTIDPSTEQGWPKGTDD